MGFWGLGLRLSGFHNRVYIKVVSGPVRVLGLGAFLLVRQRLRELRRSISPGLLSFFDRMGLIERLR